MNRTHALLLAGLVAAGAAFAQPSLYFVWKHKQTGQQMCEPQAADANWIKVAGPYSDPNCSIPEKQ